ncbi:MAG: biotin--[acetyl-CoA-carboxylase] ligase [Rhodobacteraceae bacterium]|nr:biotin--[acetyl-CoA-carboxylase] ligase [Paracoccaceae bacterium]
MSEWPQGTGRRILDIVDSTNAEGKRLAGGLTEPTWIFAKRQTSGRGRLGRAWFSFPGNLCASLALPLKDPANAPQRGFVAGLALRDAIIEQTGRPGRIELKWPNDLLINGGKLAGILLESVSGREAAHLVIGFGVNLAHAPTIVGLEKGKPKPVCLVGETGMLIAPEDFITALAQSYMKREEQYCREGFDSIRRQWLACAAGLGEKVVFRLPDREIHGIFSSIDQSGNALVQGGSGKVSVAAADMIFEKGVSDAPGN